MPEESTWESAINQDQPPVDAGASLPDTALTPAPEATETSLETAQPELDVQDTPREEESPAPTEQAQESEKADEDIQEGDTPEILALPSGSAARKWARRQFHDAEPTRKFLGTEPISAFTTDLFTRSQARYQEMVNDIISNHPDYVSQKLFGKSVDELKAKPTSDAPINDAQPQQIFTEEEINELPWGFSEKLQEYQTAQAQKEAELRTQNEAMQKRLEALEGKVTTREQTDEQRATEERANQSLKIQNDIYGEIWSVVDQGIKDAGLEVSKDDPPRIASLKRAAVKILQSEVKPTFASDKENTKVVGFVIAAADRLEKENAYRELENLQQRARIAFGKVKDSDEVKEILSEIESYAKSSAQKPKGIPPVPAPGAAAGVSVKPPSTWDEAIQGSAR